MPGKLVSLFKSKTFKYGLLIVLAAIAILIGFAMMLGNQAGQFVIRVKNTQVERSISISESLDSDTEDSSILNAPDMDGMGDYSPEYFLETNYIKLAQITANPGYTNYESKSLYIYTFYIKNKSESGGCSALISMTYSDVSGHLDEVIRVMTYYEAYDSTGPAIYQKADDYTKLGVESVEYPAYIIQPTTFEVAGNSAGTVFTNQKIAMADKSITDQCWIKYSVLIWIEGNDPDSEYYQHDGTNDLYNGTISFAMTIEATM